MPINQEVSAREKRARERRARMMSMYDQLPGGQTERERSLYGFIPGEWLPYWVKQGYNQSIEGLARQVMNGEPVFAVPDTYDPNTAEDILATIMSFATPIDAATLLLGGGLGGAAVRGAAVKTMTTEFAKRRGIAELAKKRAIAAGMEKTAAVRLVNQASAKILNQTRARAVTGATGLGFYSGLQSALGQKVTRGDIDAVMTLQDAAKGATLGALTAGAGRITEKAAAARGFGKPASLISEKGVETGVFGTVSPALEGEFPSVDSYIHAAGVIGGLTIKSAAVKKTIKVPKEMIKESLAKKEMQKSAEAQAKIEAKERRGQEEWSDGKITGRIITDWTGKERNETHIVLEDVKTGKKLPSIPKKQFFARFTRTKDNFGKNVNAQIIKRIRGLADKIGIDEIGIKEAADRASKLEDPMPLRKKKDGGYHTNLDKISQREKYKVLMELESLQRTKEILDGWRQAGITVPDVSSKSLLKRALPPEIYDSLRGKALKVKKTIGPSVYLMTDALAQKGVKLMGDMNSRNALLFSRIGNKLNNAVYVDKNGVSHVFGKLSGLLHRKKKQQLRNEISNDMEGKDSFGEPLKGAALRDARERTADLRYVTKLIYRAGRKAGLDLAPFLDNYFPRVIKSDIIKILYQDIERMGDLDHRILSSKLVQRPGFEQALEAYMGGKKISQETKDALYHIQSKMQEKRQKGAGKVTLSDAFESFRNTILREKVVLNKNLEKERTEFELPLEFYERDAGYVLTNYLAQATKRIAYAQVVGKDGKGMYTLLKALDGKKLHTQAEVLRKAFDTYTGLIEQDPKYNWSIKYKNYLNEFVNFQVATKIGLGFATIPNVTQTLVSTALKLGYAPVMKGTYKFLTNKQFRKDIKEYTGANTLEIHSLIVGYQSGQTSAMSKFAEATTGVFQFQNINRVNKIVAAFSALEAAKGWSAIATAKPKTLRQAKKRDMAIRNLRDMGVKDLSMKMTPKTMARVMYEFSRDSQLQKNVFLEPAFAANPKMQPFLLFKRFGYRQAEMIGRWANQAVKDRDLSFFLRLGAAGFAGGIFVNWAKATLSRKLAGEDIYDDNYKLDVDGTAYTVKDFIQGLMAVGSFGMITDIIGSESPWRTAEFLATPVVAQDALKIYSATIRIAGNTWELGPSWLAARHAAKYISPVFGTAVKRLARRLETPKQRADRRRTMLTATKKKIFDLMVSAPFGREEDNDKIIIRVIREWNNEFIERPLTSDDLSPEEVNKYLMRKWTRKSREMIDPATEPKKRTRTRYR